MLWIIFSEYLFKESLQRVSPIRSQRVLSLSRSLTKNSPKNEKFSQQLLEEPERFFKIIMRWSDTNDAILMSSRWYPPVVRAMPLCQRKAANQSDHFEATEPTRNDVPNITRYLRAFNGSPLERHSKTLQWRPLNWDPSMKTFQWRQSNWDPTMKTI